jgi:hypothetical protein
MLVARQVVDKLTVYKNSLKLNLEAVFLICTPNSTYIEPCCA